VPFTDLVRFENAMAGEMIMTIPSSTQKSRPARSGGSASFSVQLLVRAVDKLDQLDRRSAIGFFSSTFFCAKSAFMTGVILQRVGVPVK